MFDRTRRLRLVLVVLVMASVTIVTIDFRSRGDGPLDAVGRSIMTVIGPVQEGLVTIFRPVGNFFSGFTQVGSLKDRVRALEAENATLRAQRQQVEDVNRENVSLRRLLALRDRFNLRTMTAQVIGVSPSNFERTIFIDRGTRDGVREGMPVIGGDGLVGRVLETAASTSRVLLVTDRTSAVAGRLASNGETGVVEGDGSGSLRFQIFDPDAAVAVGQEVVTSGYDRGVYPPGIPIGRVSGVPRVRGELARSVRVQPFVDFSRLDHILLVTGERRPRRDR